MTMVYTLYLSEIIHFLIGPYSCALKFPYFVLMHGDHGVDTITTITENQHARKKKSKAISVITISKPVGILLQAPMCV